MSGVRGRVERDPRGSPSEILLDLAMSLRRDGGDVEADLQRITETATRILQVERTSVWRFDDAQHTLSCVALYDADLREHLAAAPLQVDSFPGYLKACANNRVVAVADALSDPRTEELSSYLEVNGIVSLLDAPIFSSGRALGVLCHESRARRDWTSDETSFAASLADLTTLAILADERRAIEALYRSAVDDQTDILVRTRADGTILLANAAAARFLDGAAPEALVGRSVLEFAPAANHAQILEAAAALRPDTPVAQYTHPLEIDGEVLAIVDWTLRGFFDQHGALTGYQTIGRDVTEKLQQEARLREAQRLEALAVFAGGMAHDLNNLLTPILMCSDAAIASLPDDRAEIASLREVVRAALRARDLVRQVLVFARQGSAESEPAPVDAAQLIAEAMSFVTASAPKNVRVLSNVDADCGLVRARPSDLFQVVLNLCTNAVQAMPAGGDLDVSAGVIQTARGPELQLLVRDTGAGIRPEIRSKIFDPFFTTKPPTLGTGLGLSILSRVVESMEGHVEVESVPGKGTTFAVRLPCLESEASRDSGAHGYLITGKERVLVVDDDETIVDMVHDNLRRLGYRVTACRSANEALVTFQENPRAFDVLLTDLVMPRMRGTELARVLKATRPDLTVVLMSGFDPGAVDAERAHIDAVVDKPFRIDEVARAIRSACD